MTPGSHNSRNLENADGLNLLTQATDLDGIISRAIERIDLGIEGV